MEIHRDEIEALLTQVMYQAQKAMQEKRPRFSLGSDSIVHLLNFFSGLYTLLFVCFVGLIMSPKARKEPITIHRLDVCFIVGWQGFF